MRKGKSYYKYPCKHCGKLIASNRMDYHVREKCEEFNKPVGKCKGKGNFYF